MSGLGRVRLLLVIFGADGISLAASISISTVDLYALFAVSPEVWANTDATLFTEGTSDTAVLEPIRSQVLVTVDVDAGFSRGIIFAEHSQYSGRLCWYLRTSVMRTDLRSMFEIFRLGQGMPFTMQMTMVPGSIGV